MKKLICLGLGLFLLQLSAPAFGQAPMPWDIAYHTVPTVPTFDVPEEVSQISGNLQSSINQAKQIIMTAKTDATNLQSAVTSTFNNIASGAILDVNGNPGQGEASFCGKNLDKVKVKKIAKKMKQVFLTYKSNKSADINEQNTQRKKFYMDNIYAIYAASLILQQELNTDIKTKIDLAKSCADGKGDECGIPSTDEGGNNEILFTYGKTLEAFDSVVRVWENVAALKARLKAIQIMNQIEPALATKADVVTEDDAATSAGGQTAFLGTSTINPLQGLGVAHHTETLAFAQVSYKNVSSSLANVEAAVAGSNSEAMSLISQTVEFVSPAESTNEHPLEQAQEQLAALSDMTAIEDIVTEAMSTHNMLGELKENKQIADQYAEMQKDYDKSLEKLQVADQCGIKYLGNYFNNPVKVWSGVALGKNVNSHELRKGISGWAFEAFETAKAAETSTVTTDDIAQTSVDDKTKAALLDDPDFSVAAKEGQKITTSLSTSKQEEAEAENRKSSLQSWQIGAEAAKMLGADAAKWGSPSGQKMVWTDTKNFYQQYLRRKYDNVKSYLKVYTRNDVLALVVAKLKGQKQDISETNYQKKLKEATLKTSQKVAATLQNSAASMQQYDAQSKSALSGLQKQRASLVAKMDKVSAAIKENNNKIADIRSVAEETALQKVDETINAKIVFPSVGGSVSTSSADDKIIGADAINQAVSQNNAAAVDTKKIASLEREASSNKTKLDNYQKQLDKLDDQIAQAKLNAQEKASDPLNQTAETAAALKETLEQSLKLNADNYGEDVRKNLMSILSASAKANPLINPVILIKMAENAADKSLDVLYKQVDAVIDSGYQQMLALGDDLYAPSSHQRLVEIHNQMITEVKALVLSYQVAGLVKVDNIAVYAKLLAADTTPESEGFFVGATAKARDLKAPYAIPNYDLPPVREVFHFDAHDFATIKPKVQGKTSGRSLTVSEFLNFGGDIPPIWQQILKSNAFIESNYNLEEALSSGCEDVAFSRGGIMPCVVEGSNIVLDVNSQGEYLRRSDINAASLPKCLLVETKNGKPHHSFFDTAVAFAAPVSKILAKAKKQTVEKPSAPNCSYSELGMLLQADKNNNLQFRERAFTAYNYLLDDNGGKELSDKQKNQMASAYHAMLSRNQIGDFLRHAENEKLVRENLEEYKQKYDERMASLKERLQAYGFTPSKSFDLGKDSDYKLAVNKLKSIKNQKIGEASSALAKVKTTDNAPVEEKAGILNKLIAIMKKDTDGLLKVSITTADANDLEAKLKKAKADAAVVDKYKKSLKEQAKEYNDIEQPYCANY